MDQNLEQIEIFIREKMDVSDRSGLIAKLEAERGIAGAWFPKGDPHHLTVRFDHHNFSPLTLLDTIKSQGFHGEVINIPA